MTSCTHHLSACSAAYLGSASYSSGTAQYATWGKLTLYPPHPLQVDMAPATFLTNPHLWHSSPALTFCSGNSIKPYAWAWTDGTLMDILPSYYASPSANCTRRVDCLWNAVKTVDRDEPNNVQGMFIIIH